MNPLVKKEIRLLLPGCLVILLLEALQPWIWTDLDGILAVLPVIFFFGIIILAVDSFGREFSPGTFTFLMSQPVDRRQIWRTKITVLLLASALIFAAYFTSCALRLHLAIAEVHSTWHVNPKIIGSDFRDSMIASVVVMLVALTGGLWTSLWLRQTAAAFWIALLTPTGLLFLIIFVFAKLNVTADIVAFSVLYGAAGVYSITGFWLAHRLFHRAQDAAWMGGVINFSAWRYFEGAKRATVSVRRHRPVAALVKKEFQLHGVSLICVGAVLALHIVALIVRASYGNFHKDSLVYGLTTIFWIFWLIIPLILGCTAVAEERKLGMAEGQFCLPVSRRRQFAAKFIPVLIFGMLLGGVMPVLVEGLAAYLGTPNQLFKVLATGYNNGYSTFGPGLPLASISVIALSAGMAWAGFFASTLTKNFLQALGTAIVIITAGCLFVSLNGFISVMNVTVFGVTLWRSALPILIAVPVIPVALLWLAWLNFGHFPEGWRLWRRNVLGFVVALAFVAVSSAAIYNRVWEVFEPAEPPHGPAVFSAANRPTLHSDISSGVQVRLPDGRIWFDSLGYPYQYRPNFWRNLWWSFTRPLPVSIGPLQFMAGSNWVSATSRHIEWWDSDGGNAKLISGSLDTIGVQTDGTLWISSEAKPFDWTGAKMVRYGDESNWQQVVRIPAGLLLLKKDGSLWQWGTNRLDWDHLESNWPTVRGLKPLPLRTNFDWQEIFGRWNMGFAREKDGNVWSVDWNWQMKRQTNLDQVVSQTFSGMIDGPMAYVGKDGILWANDRYYDQDQMRTMGTGRFFPTGTGTNWVAVTVSWIGMVALKSDGSLWQWRWIYNQKSPLEAAKSPPTRLGIHNDWVGLSGTSSGPVSLAADGSLWLWPGYPLYPLLKPPKQPEFLGNIFTAH
jgi:ABC-type transport system involved in multi-copper enzyme maturation permease subunit